MKKNLHLIFCLIFLYGNYEKAIAQPLIINTVTGGGSSYGDGGPATAAQLSGPTGIYIDVSGNQLIADFGGGRIRKVSTAGIITTLAGSGSVLGDGGPATASMVGNPAGICGDLSGNIYIAEQDGCRIRKINTSGIISTIAGNGTCSVTGDGGLATAATVGGCTGIATDATGNIYFVEWTFGRVRMINTAGYISTIAGGGSVFGDGGPATAAMLTTPYGISLDGLGNLFIGLEGQNRVREVNLSTGIITTYAGTGTGTYTGDSGPASAATMFEVDGIYANASVMYITVGGNNNVRAVNRSTGIITTLAGSSGVAGFSGDGGFAVTATLRNAPGVSIDGAGNIYIADYENARIREVYRDHLPKFTNGERQTIAICEDSAPDTLNAYLPIQDSDVGQTETWALLSVPSHGTINAGFGTVATGGVLYTTTSTGGTITLPIPTVEVFYEPTTGYSGPDSFSVVINDGNARDTTEIVVSVSPLPTGMSGHFNVCQGDTISLTDAATGGMWSSGNTAVATVGPGSGVVTGVSAGMDTITYRFTNSCGTVTTATTITVDPSSAGVISGVDTLCQGDTIILAETISGGVWAATDPLISIVSASGVLGGVSPGVDTITYTVAGTCITGGAATKTIVIISLADCETTEVTTITESGSLKVFPNPNHGTFTVILSSGNDEQMHLVITNLVGEKVKEYATATNKSFDVKFEAAPGVYFLSATTAHTNYMVKVMVE